MGRQPADAEGGAGADRLSPEIANLIESARERAESGADRRERRTELGVSAAFACVATAMALALPHRSALSPASAAWLLAICVVLLRIEFEVGEGRTRPVQLVLAPMLVLLPAPVVPLVVAVAHLLAGLPDIAARRVKAERAILSVANSWFSVGPALVVSLTGVPDGPSAWALIVTAALAAELGLDLAISALRLRLGLAIGISSQLRLFGWVYLVDVLLTPIALLAAVASLREPLAAGAVLPLAGLLAMFAQERRGRIENALELHRMARESEARLQSIVQNSSDLIAILERDGRIRTLTGSVAPLFGPSWREVLGSSLLDHAHPDDRALLTALLAGVANKAAGESLDLEWRIRRADGTWLHVETVATNLLDDPRLDGIVLTARDVDERKAFEEQLRHRAFHDPLTQLANRALFYDRIEHALAHEARDDRLVSVLFLDLDEFKQLNDRFGHAAGDELLIEVARRLRDCVRAIDTVARLGGDEFGVLLDFVSGSSEAVQVAERILAAFHEPVELGAGRVAVEASLGIAISAPEDRGVDELLRRADLAMYAAKRNRSRCWELYELALERVSVDGSSPGETAHDGRSTWYQRGDEQRQEILDCLQRDGAIEAVYQPIVDLRTGMISGYEALARFADPLNRPPNLWFAQAHRHGLGYQLEAKALRAALLAPGRPRGSYLTLNVSPSALASGEVQAVLPERLDGLVIEITENELASGEPALPAAIAAVRARGGRLAVDDAGSGYAGLKHVVRLAPDLIKLDRALIDGVHTDPVKAALIESFVRYAREIDAAVCAEGIETLDDLTRLAELDVTYGQGYAIARPGPPWAPVAAQAAAACSHSYAETLGLEPPATGDQLRDRRLDVITGLLANAADEDDLTSAMPAVARQLNAEAVAVSVLDGTGEQLVGVGRDGPLASGDRRLADDPAIRALLECPRLFHVLKSDPAADPRLIACMHELGYPSLLMLPLRCAGETIGLIEIYRAEERPWSREELGRARIVSHQLAGALERTRLPSTRLLLPAVSR
ncbi:MAG: diguanylate cyclase domain-containing protein [Solirubrobacteraceae bacterium]